MWRYVGNGAGYPGLPYGDLTDEEMQALVAEYEPRFKATHGTVKDSGLWVRDDGKQPATPAPPLAPPPEEQEG